MYTIRVEGIRIGRAGDLADAVEVAHSVALRVCHTVLRDARVAGVPLEHRACIVRWDVSGATTGEREISGRVEYGTSMAVPYRAELVETACRTLQQTMNVPMRWEVGEDVPRRTAPAPTTNTEVAELGERPASSGPERWPYGPHRLRR